MRKNKDYAFHTFLWKAHNHLGFIIKESYCQEAETLSCLYKGV